MRRLLTALHLYVGLAAGLLLAVIGLTGSVLVFDHAWDEVLAPHTRVAPSAARAPLQRVIDAARAAVPGAAAPTRIQMARQLGSAHVVRFPAPPGAPGPIEVSVAPSDARVLTVRGWGVYPISWLYRLHATLLAGTTGKYVVGVSGLLLLFFCISGLYLWWPRRGAWRRALTIQRGSGRLRLHLDLHKTVGFYALAVLSVVAFSGISLVFHDAIQGLAGSVLEVRARPEPRSGLQPGAVMLTVDQAVARGRAVFPDAELKRVFLPQGPAGTYRLALNRAGEPWTAHAVSTVWVDAYSGAILATWDALALPAGSAFLAWQFPLHNGDALGLPGRWLVFVSGWVPALLFATGLYTWWYKRRRRASGPRHRALAVADRSVRT